MTLHVHKTRRLSLGAATWAVGWFGFRLLVRALSHLREIETIKPTHVLNAAGVVSPVASWCCS